MLMFSYKLTVLEHEFNIEAYHPLSDDWKTLLGKKPNSNRILNDNYKNISQAAYSAI